jgi:CubicO group peptidase (beta-lactamase class C family)
MLMVAVAACTPGTFQPVTSPSQIDVWPTVEWRHATPESQGFDSVTLTEAIQAAADTRALHSLFVARSGYEIVDATAYPYDDSMYHDLASVTKSVLTTLLGIAVDRDELDPDASIVGFFPDHTISDRERKEEITVRHLAGMTTGLACSNIPDETELAQMQASSDFVEFALDLDVMTEPGSGFSYCSPGMHLLSAIIQQATGMSARDYAQVTLFDPLGIQEVHWPADAQGVTHGWGDLALHPEDAAKLGELFLHEGEWDGQRIVSSEWVAEATTGHMPTNLHEDYGYGWYVAPDGEEVDYFRADGNGGQRILVAPEFGLVMVTTGAGLAADDLLEAVYGAATDGAIPYPPTPPVPTASTPWSMSWRRGPRPSHRRNHPRSPLRCRDGPTPSTKTRSGWRPCVST